MWFKVMTVIHSHFMQFFFMLLVVVLGLILFRCPTRGLLRSMVSVSFLWTAASVIAGLLYGFEWLLHHSVHEPNPLTYTGISIAIGHLTIWTVYLAAQLICRHGRSPIAADRA